MVRIEILKKLHSAAGVINLNVSFKLEDGSISALCGPSGSGKTTILRMLAGLTAPDSGSIQTADCFWYDGAAGINISPQERVVGLVFQDYPLFPKMTILKNLLYAEDNQTWAAQLLEMVDMEGLASKYPRQISGGQRQRVALAQALMRRPRILLLDEPFSALDGKMRDRVRRVLLTIRNQYKVIVLLATHDEKEAARLEADVFHIVDGKVQISD